MSSDESEFCPASVAGPFEIPPASVDSVDEDEEEAEKFCRGIRRLIGPESVGLGRLLRDCRDFFEALESAEDRFEGGDRPRAKSLRAAAAASAARTVGEFLICMDGELSLLVLCVPPNLAAALVGDAVGSMVKDLKERLGHS